MLGDCWLLSTCAALAKKEELLFRVIDPKQVLGQNQSTNFFYKNGIWPKIKLRSLVEVCLTFNHKQIWKNGPKTLADT